MHPKSPRVFIDTSVLFDAILSPTGGSRRLFQLAEAGIVRLVVGPTVLREADGVVRRKAASSRPLMAQLLDSARVETSQSPTKIQVESARKYVRYAPDARVLAEAICADRDWFVTLDKEHFLNKKREFRIGIVIGTPGDLIQSIKQSLYLP